jgi:hypothetical protein
LTSIRRIRSSSVWRDASYVARSGLAAAGVGAPSAIWEARIEASIVLVVDRHVGLPRGLGRSPKRALCIEQSFAAELIPRSGRFTDLGALQR